MSFFELTTLQYAEPRKGDSFLLYVYGLDGYHIGGQWFTSGTIRYPDEEITAAEALERAKTAIAKGFQVRVTDSGDMLVFHSEHGNVSHPKDATVDDFWGRL